VGFLSPPPSLRGFTGEEFLKGYPCYAYHYTVEKESDYT